MNQFWMKGTSWSKPRAAEVPYMRVVGAGTAQSMSPVGTFETSKRPLGMSA